MPRNDLTEAQIAQIQESFKRTGDKTATGKECGVTRGTVAKWVKEMVRESPSITSTPPPASPSVVYATPPAQLALLGLLKKHPLTLQEIAAKLDISKGQALDLCDSLHSSGINLHCLGDRYSIEKAPPLEQPRGERFEFESSPSGEYHFGLIGDSHLGSKYERLDVLNDLYDKFEAEGVTRVYHCGNWIEGEARFNKFDLHTYGMDNQVNYFIKNYPQRKGITTLYVAGDDHEGWYNQREGVDIGRYLELQALDAGRTDLQYLCYMDAYITLKQAQSGETNKMLISHPGGGSSYADSYVIQKLVESMEGGEKPAVAAWGHFHKMLYDLIRNVHCVLVGCQKDQDVFGRKKRLRYVIGGMIVRMMQDKQGAITRFQPEFFQYFNRAFYNNQWSHSGGVDQTPLRPANTSV